LLLTALLWAVLFFWR
ncbi:rCG33225, partial [Rattus norvegicus]